MIDARNYRTELARERREQFAPEGPDVAFSGGQVWDDHEMLWRGLDSIKARVPEMILATTAQTKGCDAIAQAWAAARGVKVILFRLDRRLGAKAAFVRNDRRSEEHTSELQSLMRISYAVFCLKKKTTTTDRHNT